MCLLCSEFATRVHWSEQAPAPGGADPTRVEAGHEGVGIRLRQRYRRLDIVNQLLRSLGLKVYDWNGAKYVVDDHKGNVTLVDDLGGIWGVVETRLGRRLDPLDPEWLEVLSRRPERDRSRGQVVGDRPR